MNKRASIFAVLAVLTVNAFAQTSFYYMSVSLNLLKEWQEIIPDFADFEYNGTETLWGTYLEAGKNISRNLRLDAGVEYLMLAAAHTTGSEIHLKVYRGQGTEGTTVIDKSRAHDSQPISRFKPSDSGWHCFELLNVSKQPAFVSLIVLKKIKNTNFSLIAIDETIRKSQSVSKEMDSSFPNSKIPPNKWTLFGGNTREGSFAGLLNVQLPRLPLGGKYALVGVGENSLNNCDVEVIEQYAADNQDGRTITPPNNSVSPYRHAFFLPEPSKYYYPKVINKSSRNPSAFVLGFLISGQEKK